MHLEEESQSVATPFRLTALTIAGSAVLALGLLGVYRAFQSQIALAQAADSLFDMIGGGGLMWALHHSQRPADQEHPQGHSLAQPVAALVVAVLAGVLAAEVLRSALSALLGAARPHLDWPAAGVFSAKVVFKTFIVIVCARSLRRRRNAALAALRMDARNDVLVGSLALVGLFLERVGLPRVDSILAIGIALYIAYAGLRLGRENASLLLGESATLERQQELTALAAAVPGVRGTSALLAVWRGSLLHVQLSIQVDPMLSLREAHAIGHAVETKLSAAPDVGPVVVHVEPQ